MAKLRPPPDPEADTKVPGELKVPWHEVWQPDAAADAWRAAHGLPAGRHTTVVPGYRRRHRWAVDDWARAAGLTDEFGHADWHRLGQLLG